MFNELRRQFEPPDRGLENIDPIKRLVRRNPNRAFAKHIAARNDHLCIVVPNKVVHHPGLNAPYRALLRRSFNNLMIWRSNHARPAFPP